MEHGQTADEGKTEPPALDDNCSEDQQGRDEGPEYPTGLRLTLIFAALCLTVLLVALVRARFFLCLTF